MAKKWPGNGPPPPRPGRGSCVPHLACRGHADPGMQYDVWYSIDKDVKFPYYRWDLCFFPKAPPRSGDPGLLRILRVKIPHTPPE